MRLSTAGSALTDERLNATFGALADPTRRAILGRLAAGEATVSDLAKPFAISLPAISKHLKVLERAGLIARSRNAHWRPCRLETERLRDASTWIDTYRAFWESSFDSLDAHLTTIQSGTRPPRSDRP